MFVFQLQHIQGSVGLTPACEQVDVPHLRPGEEGIVSVLFTTPAVPGVYRSHWNFCHKSRPFGHIVWCHIVVKDPETDGKQTEIASEGFTLSVSSMPNEKVCYVHMDNFNFSLEIYCFNFEILL